MSVTIALDRSRPKRPWKLRILTRLAICAARLLVFLKPHTLRRVLIRLSKGAAAADAVQAKEARDSVLASSLSLHGLRACLPRSLSTALLCRFRGVWPTWCVGVRTAPPFAAHAWVEVDEELIGETGGYASYSRLFTVPPVREDSTAPAPSGDHRP